MLSGSKLSGNRSPYAFPSCRVRSGRHKHFTTMGARAKKRISRFLISWGILFMAGVATFLAAFFFGHHNVPMSRSFFLEKEIRSLHFLETHEPVDYALAADLYESLLSRIRFGNRAGNHTERYERALARSRKKARIIELVQAHEFAGEERALIKAHELFISAEYRKLEVHHFTLIVHGGERLTDAWFLARMGEAGAETRRESSATWSGADAPALQEPERIYAPRSFIPSPSDFLALFLLWLLGSLGSVASWVGTRKLLGW